MSSYPMKKNAREELKIRRKSKRIEKYFQNRKLNDKDVFEDSPVREIRRSRRKNRKENLQKWMAERRLKKEAEKKQKKPIFAVRRIVYDDSLAKPSIAGNTRSKKKFGGSTIPTEGACSGCGTKKKSTKTGTKGKPMQPENENVQECMESLSIDNNLKMNSTESIVLGPVTFEVPTNLLQIETLDPSKTLISILKKKTCSVNDSPPHTPAKTVRTPVRRKSITPNPKLFLSKLDDPVAIRIDSPLARKYINELTSEVSESAAHFTGLVATEDEKLKCWCDTWDTYLESNKLPEEAHGHILSAIGQAQLLRGKRFKQFKELIELHKDKTAEKAALAGDLEGFWEMIYIQVKDVYRRFEELHLLKEKNWVEEKLSVKLKKAAPIKTKHVKEVKSKPRNDFKKFRKEMLMKKQENIQNEDHSYLLNSPATRVPKADEKPAIDVEEVKRKPRNDFKKFRKEMLAKKRENIQNEEQSYLLNSPVTLVPEADEKPTINNQIFSKYLVASEMQVSPMNESSAARRKESTTADNLVAPFSPLRI